MRTKLTLARLRQLVVEEFSALNAVEDVEAEEVDASDYADTIENHIDYIKALKIEEAKFNRKLKSLVENKSKRAQR